jgi:hypothetical protein
MISGFIQHPGRVVNPETGGVKMDGMRTQDRGTDKHGEWQAAPDQTAGRSVCRTCHEPIWFGPTFKKDGTRGKVSSHDVVDGVLTTRNHWATCEKREEFRRLMA